MTKRTDLKPDLNSWTPLLIQLWRKLEKEPGPPDRLQTREFRRTAALLKDLHDSWDGESPKSDLLDKRDALGAYLLYFWPLHFSQGLSLIGELPQTPDRVLDIGAGLSPFGAAALKAGAREVIATDKRPELLRWGAEIAGRGGYTISTRHWDILKTPLPVEGKFDLVLVSYLLREIYPSTMPDAIHTRSVFIESLLEKVNENGSVMIVDSSFDPANREMLILRDKLVEKGYTVQAPCVWKGECPALKSKFPCFAQRPFEKTYLLQELQRAAGIFLSSLKMSYLIIKKGEWPTLRREPLYRVVSPPIESYLGKRYYLCGTDGKKSVESQLEQFDKKNRAFEYLKRGELIYLKDALEKKDHYIVTADTEVEVEAPAGKAVPETSDTEE